jgi:S1-C subfamily serine protease
MKRRPLYSRASRRRESNAAPLAGSRAGAPPPPAAYEDSEPSLRSIVWNGLRTFVRQHERAVLLAACALISAASIGSYALLKHEPRQLSQNDIDAAVQYTMANKPRPPAETARAAAIIRPSVVEVQGFLSPEHAAALAEAAAKAGNDPRAHHGVHEKAPQPPAASPPTLPDKPVTTGAPDEQQPDAIGSGVVVNEGGAILTALHVVSSTDRVVIVFADGTKSEATLVGAQPENDLAALQARNVPDELQPAILASTAGLMPGDKVVATGFPFGIGPSVSAGVVSGLKREFDDPSRHQKYTNLIQFDAAVNPGNSGGPLVNRDGEVIGIVTAILNPSNAGVFAGIGFAVPIENAARAFGDNPL